MHRREGFRAHEATVGQVHGGHASAAASTLHVPYQIKDVHGNGAIERVELFHSERRASVIELESTRSCCSSASRPQLGPLKEWGFEVDKGAIVVDRLMKTILDRVWACGDITTFDGKLKLIATGFAEAAIAVAQAVHASGPT